MLSRRQFRATTLAAGAALVSQQPKSQPARKRTVVDAHCMHFAGQQHGQAQGIFGDEFVR